jgi:TRAP-type C4-dicarboxylate transport system permease small subunit
MPLRRLLDRLNVSLAFIAGISMLAMTALTTNEVIARYFLNAPTIWSLEITEYLMVVCVYFGMAYATQKGAHVSVPLVYKYLSRQPQRVLDITTSFLMLVFWLVLFWQTSGMAAHYLINHVRSETILAFPLFYPMSIVAVGCLTSCLQAILILYDHFAVPTGKA